MNLFWICWGIDVLLLVTGLLFFLSGMESATEGSGFYRTWAVTFLIMGGIVGGSYFLKSIGWNIPALILAALPAILAALYLLWVLMIIIFKPRWN